jgi:elongation factor G
MPLPTMDHIRNFAIVGHRGSGKTMLTEAMLATSGCITRMGSIEQGNTVSDYHRDEQDRKISIHSSITHLDWLDRKFNVIDTPGYLDFVAEAMGALRVVDFAMVVVDAHSGVEVSTEEVWRIASAYDLPKFIVLNGFDKENASFEDMLAEVRERFGPKVFPLSIPVNPGAGFNQLLDVMRSDIVTYAEDGSGKYQEIKATGEWATKVRALHRELIEHVAEADDSLLEKFFENDSLSEEDLRAGVHTAIQNQSFIPLWVTSATKNIGVARMMDWIAKYGSSPVDRETVTGQNEKGQEQEIHLADPSPVAFVFKTIAEQHVGDLSFVRVYSGRIETGQELTNANRGVVEKIGQIFVVNGKSRQLVSTLSRGDIGAIVKMKDTHTGNTLCEKGKNIRLPQVDYPRPNIHSALKLLNSGDEDRLSGGITSLHEEDPSFHYHVDEETHETVISGQGDLHLQVIKQGLKDRFNVSIDLAEPRIPFRETIQGRAEEKYRHKKQSGGAGQFAEVWMRVEPLPRDSGVLFEQTLVGQNVDRVFVPSVEKGVRKACKTGVIAGYPVVDLKVTFYDGKMHPVDSKDIAFQIAGEKAFRACVAAAKPCLLEPILLITVKVPEDCVGDVMGDLSSRGGKIQGIDTDGTMQVVHALMPQRETYHYSTRMRSLTGGRCLYSEVLDHYEEMPRSLAQKIIDSWDGHYEGI